MYSTNQLIQLAAQQGITISRRTLSDWAARELISHPIQRGQGRGAGAIYEWSGDTLDRILLIAPVMKGFHNESFAVMLLWFNGLDVPMMKVRTAILSTREMFISFAAMRQDMISQIGASASRDDQADWVSHRAMQIAGGNHELADDLEAMFHLLVTDRPDANIITSMIRRAVAEHPLAGRLPTRKDINGVLNFFRQDIAIQKLVDNATEKPDDDWLRARRQWIHVLRTTRRFSESLGLNREDFRTMGYQAMIVIAPFIFLALLLWDDPRKRRWLAILNHSSLQFKKWAESEPDNADLIRAFILRRSEHMAVTSKLGRIKSWGPKPRKPRKPGQ